MIVALMCFDGGVLGCGVCVVCCMLYVACCVACCVVCCVLRGAWCVCVGVA
jgi:hypothetical protein